MENRCGVEQINHSHLARKVFNRFQKQGPRCFHSYSTHNKTMHFQVKIDDEIKIAAPLNLIKLTKPDQLSNMVQYKSTVLHKKVSKIFCDAVTQVS